VRLPKEPTSKAAWHPVARREIHSKTSFKLSKDVGTVYGIKNKNHFLLIISILHKHLLPEPPSGCRKSLRFQGAGRTNRRGGSSAIKFIKCLLLTYYNTIKELPSHCPKSWHIRCFEISQSKS